VKKDTAETYVLFELIASRYESGSLVITSNYAFREWNNIFATNSMTVAAIDRLVHHARILEISTDSYRRRHALEQQMQEQLDTNEQSQSGAKIIDNEANKEVSSLIIGASEDVVEKEKETRI
jgi:hypothetical protein